jgi:nucleoside-diphosphate-sugar epimerase
MRVLIIGCGYVGLPLGTELVKQGHEVFGLRRSPAFESELKAAGIKPLYADISNSADLAKLPGDFDWVVNCAATRGGSVEDYRRVYFTGTRNLLEWLLPTPPLKYVYTSSTSVYGQYDGSWVVETDPTSPESETGKVLIATENLLLTTGIEKNFPVVILRLAGLYGSGRGYWLNQFLQGEAKLDGDGSRFLNMLHRDDAVGAIIAALELAPAGSIYNTVDNEPVSQQIMFEWLAEKLKRPMPPSAAEAPSRKRGASNKRVSNQRLRKQLGYEFKFPTFREGFTAEISKRTDC